VIGPLLGRSRAGFSAAELVITAAIGALLLVAVPTGQGLLAARRLAGAARKLAGDLRAVEQRARAERRCFRVVFDSASETYGVYRYGGTVRSSPSSGSACADQDAWALVPLVGEDAAGATSRRMPPGVDLVGTSFARNTLSMSPLGNANAGGACLRTRAGSERWVRVEVMGRTEILSRCR
jgi:hypothetical protein